MTNSLTASLIRLFVVDQQKVVIILSLFGTLVHAAICRNQLELPLTDDTDPHYAEASDLVVQSSQPREEYTSNVEPLTVTAAKPEAFLVHLKPKAKKTANKSKFLLLLRLPDGSDEIVSFAVKGA